MIETRWRFRWLCAMECRRQNKRLSEKARTFYTPERTVVLRVKGGKVRHLRRWRARSQWRTTSAV